MFISFVLIQVKRTKEKIKANTMTLTSPPIGTQSHNHLPLANRTGLKTRPYDFFETIVS
ncbi:MAG: hypothetical protein J7K51_07475 [Thermotogae bacterium]|nr:hypothetical protein [Thermotogota bacterium]